MRVEVHRGVFVAAIVVVWVVVAVAFAGCGSQGRARLGIDCDIEGEASPVTEEVKREESKTHPVELSTFYREHGRVDAVSVCTGSAGRHL